MKAMIKFKVVNPKISAERIEEFQIRNGITIPDDYKEFLLRTNGGVPANYHILEFVHNTKGKEQVTLQELFGIEVHSSKMITFDIDEIKEITRETLQSEYLAIGMMVGDHIMAVIRLSGSQKGHIFLWDDQLVHNNEKAYHFVASSFEEFLDLLRQVK